MATQVNKVRGWFGDKLDELKHSFKKEFLSEPPSKTIKNILWTVVGNIVLAFADVIFLLPCNIVDGGISGMALIFGKWFNFLGNTSVMNITITCLSVFFYVLGIFIVGIGFTARTLIATAVYPLFVYIFNLLLNDVSWLSWLQLSGIAFDSSGAPQYAVTTLAGLFGGVLSGVAMALAFRGGGSTGGTDCIVLALAKHTKLKASTTNIIVDSIVIITGMLTYRDLLTGMIGILSSMTCSIMVAKLFIGPTSTYTATIISVKWQEISDQINHEMERGTTIYNAKGGYTGVERKVVAVSFSRSEYRDLMRIVNSTDPAAFVTVQTTYEIQGYGFSYDDGDNPIPLKSRHSFKDMIRGQRKAQKEEQRQVEEKERDMKKDLKEVLKEEKSNKDSKKEQ